MNIIKKLFRRKDPLLNRFKPSQRWVCHNDDGDSLVTHILTIHLVEDGLVAFDEHTSWQNNGPEDGETERGYHQLPHVFSLGHFNELVVQNGFLLLRHD